MKLHLVVVGRNNQQWAAMNLGGIMGQLGGDFDVRTTWIDDASTDSTQEIAKRLIIPMPPSFVIMANPVRCGGLSNILVAAMKDSDPDEIIITWDADDFFASPHVFQRIAQEYRDPECWMTYGGYRTWPRFERGLPEGGYGPWAGMTHPDLGPLRLRQWVCEPPRSFYAGMLKHVPPAYLSDPEGRLYEVAWDFALYMALMERAGTHLRYIPDVLYLYNESNPLSDFRTRREMLISTGEQVRSMIPLEPLTDKTW